MLIAFCHIEKTAGSTMNWILRRSFGFSHCDVHSMKKQAPYFSAADYKLVSLFYRDIRSIAGHDVKPFGDLETVRKDISYYTFLRDPLTRCASHYQFQIKRMGKSIPFEDWIQKEKYRNFQTAKLSPTKDAAEAIDILRRKFFFVGLAEKFDESILILKTLVKDTELNINYEYRNKAEDNSIKNELLKNPVKRALLEDANTEDLNLYRFVKEELYPEFVRRYTGDLVKDLDLFQQNKHEPEMTAQLKRTEFKRKYIYKVAVKAAQLLNR